MAAELEPALVERRDWSHDNDTAADCRQPRRRITRQAIAVEVLCIPLYKDYIHCIRRLDVSTLIGRNATSCCYLVAMTINYVIASCDVKAYAVFCVNHPSINHHRPLPLVITIVVIITYVGLDYHQPAD